ncbi:MFS transporter [Candidatus Acetothermia bacterium]|nr:MFS transporter [Candidatus Acetothermia bacterium]MBI3661106.1 MFS transporter [Candidatus Acetothermia bacterium]
MLHPYRALFAHRDYLLLTAGNLIAAAGDNILFLALLSKVYELTHSPLNLGITTILEAIPGIFISPMAGYFIDRWDRKRIMIAADLFNVLAVVGLISASKLWQIYFIAFLVAVGSAIFQPANNSLLPNLLSRNLYLLGNSFRATLQNVRQMTGPALGGVLVTFAGFPIACLATAGCFGLSALCTFFIRASGYATKAPKISEEKLGFWQEFSTGWRVILASNVLKFVVMYQSLIVFVMSMQAPIIYVFVKEVLHEGPWLVGVLFSTIGVGGIAGGLLMSAWGHRIKNKLAFALLVLSFDGVVLLAFALNTFIPLSIFLFSLLGVIGTVNAVIFNTILQEEVPDSVRGRVHGGLGPIYRPIEICSVGLGTWLSSVIGVVLVLAGASVAELVVAVGSYFLPAYRRARSRATATPSEETATR